jgi:hypothetical protein
VVHYGRVYDLDGKILEPGEEIRPHEGEWVEMFATSSVGELRAIRRLRELGSQLAAVKGDKDEESESLQLSDDAFEDLVQALAPRVVAWNWTDNAGRPMPQPDSPTVLRMLQPEELMWLLGAAQGETPSARKNACAPSETISSDSVPQEMTSKRCTEGLSLTRAS